VRVWGWAIAAGGGVALVGGGTAAWVWTQRGSAAELAAFSVPDQLDPEIGVLVTQRLNDARAASGDPDARLALAMACHANAMLETAIVAYEQTLSMNPRLARAWHLLAMARHESGDLDGAVQAARTAARLAPTYSPAHWRLGLYELEARRLDRSREAFEAAAKINPADLGASSGLARVHLLQGRSQQAVDLLAPLTSKPDADPYLHHLLGLALRDLGRWEEARLALARGSGAAASFPDVWVVEMRRMRTGYRARIEDAHRLTESGQAGAALQVLAPLAIRRPDDPAVISALAAAHMRLNQPDTALDLCLAAMRRGVDHYSLHLNLAHLYAARNDPTRALAHAGRAIEQNPALAPAHLVRADLHHRAGRFEDAAASARQALRTGGRDLNALLMLGDSLMSMNRTAEAIGAYQQAAAAYPASALPRLGLAQARARGGDLQAALAELQLARSLEPSNPKVASMADHLLRQRAAERGGSAPPPR
jgi:tetratricopeptide (TPR) repeat protein